MTNNTSPHERRITRFMETNAKRIDDWSESRELDKFIDTFIEDFYDLTTEAFPEVHPTMFTPEGDDFADDAATELINRIMEKAFKLHWNMNA